MDDSQTLRLRLAEIIDPEHLDQQVQLVELLRKEYPHSIRVVERVNLADRRTWRFNCHAFTFRLSEWDEFFDPVKDREVWPEVRFVSEVMLPTLIEKPRECAVDGDVVVYSTDTRVVHSGVVHGQLIRSKWGTGHVWDHGTFEMPASYGWLDRYYARPSAAVAPAAFQAFASAMRRGASSVRENGSE